MFDQFPVIISAGSLDTPTTFRGFPGPSSKYRESTSVGSQTILFFSEFISCPTSQLYKLDLCLTVHRQCR
jgi:hypothetical protein